MTIDARAVRSQREVTETLARLHVASRAEIQAATGLSASTVASVVRGLLADGRVRELPVREARGPGRPVSRLVLDEVPGHVVGVDVGHRHVSVGVATVGERLLRRRRVENDGTLAADEVLDVVARTVEELLREEGLACPQVRACVVSVPAPVEPGSGRVHDAPIVVPAWRGRYPARDLEQRLGFAVTAANDANAGVVGERLHGAASGVDDVVYLNATVGIGAGLVLGGRVYTGPDGAAGEIGHIRLPGAMALCRCAQHGCLESEASLRALVPRLEAVGVDVSGGVGADLLAAHAADPAVARLLSDVGRGLGSVLADLCNLLSPSMIVVGGELAAGGEALRSGIRESLRRHALSTISSSVRIEFSELGLDAPLRGAVALAAQAATASAVAPSA